MAAEFSGTNIVHGISRHQLYVHPDIPYTSHNSSLCLDLDWLGGEITEVSFLGSVIRTRMLVDGQRLRSAS